MWGGFAKNAQANSNTWELGVAHLQTLLQIMKNLILRVKFHWLLALHLCFGHRHCLPLQPPLLQNRHMAW